MTSNRALTLGASAFYDPKWPCIDFCRYVLRHGVEWIEVKLEPVFYYSEMNEDDVAKYLSEHYLGNKAARVDSGNNMRKNA
jgi:hypothetical protein